MHGMERRGGKILKQKTISEKEINSAMSRLKMGKAPGVDGITTETLKSGGHHIRRVNVQNVYS